MLPVLNQRLWDKDHLGNRGDRQSDPAVMNHWKIDRNRKNQVAELRTKGHRGSGNGPARQQNVESVAAINAPLHTSIESHLAPQANAERRKILVDYFGIAKHQASLGPANEFRFQPLELLRQPDVVLIRKRNQIRSEEHTSELQSRGHL